MAFNLKVISGPNAGQTLPLTPGQVHVIGRGAEAQLCIAADQTLSRVHAEVYDQGGQWYLRNKSQHGTLIGGEVIHDQRPLMPGAQFQVGGSQIVLEGAPDMAGAMAPAGGGAPAAAGGAGGGAGAGFGGGAAGAAAADALKSLPEGPVHIDGSQPGFPYGALIKGGLGIAKANLVPSLVVLSPMIIFQVLGQVVAHVPLPGIVRVVLGLGFAILGLIASLLTPLLVANYMAGVKRYQETGTPIAIGDLLSFQGALGKYLVQFVVGIGFACCWIPGFLLFFSLPIYIDNPGAPLGSIFKTSLAFVKQNLVPSFLLLILLGIVADLGFIACGVGVLFTAPAMMAAQYLAYECKRDEFLAAASDSGISLG